MSYDLTIDTLRSDPLKTIRSSKNHIFRHISSMGIDFEAVVVRLLNANGIAEMRLREFSLISTLYCVWEFLTHLKQHTQLLFCYEKNKIFCFLPMLV